MKKYILLFVLLAFNFAYSQNSLSGTVYDAHEKNHKHPLVGANIIWLGTNIGTSTNENGEFQIKRSSLSNKLLVSFIGYISDTITVGNESNIQIELKQEDVKLNEVSVTGSQSPTYTDYFGVENKSVMTQKELTKAACCTLSESFETNPSIDVSFTDAITGARQIEMLGLSGIYTQSTLENLPYIRGLISNVGLTYVPGPWVKAINVAKGIGSVVNGFESITGQIDVDLFKPFAIDEKPILLNVYGDYDRRVEGNINYRHAINDQISFVTLLHASSRQHGFDMNNDMFIDMPKFSIFNLMQRWQIHFENGWESQVGFQLLSDKKEGGSFENSLYNFSTDGKQFNIYGKTGYVFPESEYKSFGFQWSFNRYEQNSLFGIKDYSGIHNNGYLNFIYQSDLGDTQHKFRTGVSFLFDQFEERFTTLNFTRTERIPGAYFEYSYNDDDKFSAVVGLRSDYHNYFGMMFTPRIHLRYAPSPDWVLRASGGRGFRNSNIFSENISLFASSRNLMINASENFGYGLPLETAWNFGFNLTHYFLFDYREGTISIDFYRTKFENVTIADLDTNPQRIIFSSVENGMYSNSFQAELNFKPFESIDFRAAYRLLDVNQLLNNSWVQKSLSSKHRALINIGWASSTNEEDIQTKFDITLNWFGEKRIPSTASNPANLRMDETSPSFAVVNAQITRTIIFDLELYIGVENLFDFKQNNLIIDPGNPYGSYFDASLIWGPVNGRMVYSGLRYRI